MKGVFKSTPLFIAAGLLCLAAPAFAHWEVSYEYEGTTTRNEAFEGGSPPVSKTHPWSYYSCVYATGLAIESSAMSDLTQDCAVDGKVRAVLTWIPDSPNQPVPSTVSVREQLEGGARVYKVGANEDPSESNTIDGTNGSSTVTVDLATTIPDPESNYASSNIAKGIVLKIYPTDGKTVVPLPWRKLKASATGTDFTDPDGAWVYGYVQAGVSYKAQEDKRSVTLSRSGAAYEWQTNDGGVPVVYGDTTYSHVSHFQASASQVTINPISITASLSGSWSQNVVLGATSGQNYIDWNWGGDVANQGGANGLKFRSIAPVSDSTNSYDAWNSMSRATELGNLEAYYQLGGNDLDRWAKGFAPGDGYLEQVPAEGPHEPKSAQTATIKYFVRDKGDGAQIEARYKLTVHEPIEIDHQDPIASNSVGPFPLFEPDGSLAGLVAPIPDGGTDISAPHTYSRTMNYGFSSGWAFGLDGGLGIDKAFSLLGFDVGASIGANGQYSWQNYIETAGTPGCTYAQPLQPGQGLYIQYTVVYNDHTAYYRWYEPGGEIKRSGSPVPQAGVMQAPLPSNPWVWKWQTKVGTSLSYKVVNVKIGDHFPDRPASPDITLPSPKFS